MANGSNWVLYSQRMQEFSDLTYLPPSLPFFLFVCCCFSLKSLNMLCISGWPGIHCAVEAGFKVMRLSFSLQESQICLSKVSSPILANAIRLS